MPRTSRISLNFTDFDLHFEYTNLNRSDRIEITTLDENPETVAVLYGNTTTKPVLEVDYSAVRLRFITFTTTQRHRGFKLRYNRLYGSCYRDVEDTSGVIKLNMQPRSAIFISCRWKIKVPKGQRVTLEFDKFEAESVNNNTERFISSIQRYPNFLTTKMSFFNDPDMLSKITEIMNDFSLPDKILSSDNFMYIRIDIYQRITTFRKIQVRYSSDEESACPPDINEQVFGSINTNNLPPNVNFFCNSKFGLSGFETITFKIKELLVYGSNTNRFAYAIRFKDERSLMALKTINTNATDTTVSISSQGGTLSILQTDLLKIRRFSVDFYRHACGGSFHVLDVPKIVFPTENFVHNGDESPIECSWTITNTGARSPLKLVGNLSLDNDCSKEYISIRSRLSPDYTETIKLCHNSTELTTGIPLKQSIVTILYSTNKYRSSSTFQIAVETTVACGMRTRVVTNMNTPVVSVNSKTYKNNMECSWEFETITGLYMTVEFTGRFFIEKSVNCSKDYLQIYAYEDEVWQPKERYCGRDVPNSYNGTSNRLLIVFRTDNATRGDGFTFRISPSCTATFNVTDQLQMVQPPTDEIGTYSRLRCSYTFLTSSDNAINVQIISNTLFARRRYYLNQPCPYGMFTAYKKDDDGNEIQSGEYCRSVEVNAKHYLRISSDVSFDTFLITYQLDTCGGNITSYANIRPLMADNSDGGDYQYANNMNCVWNVMAPPDHSIVVRFKYFDMEEHDQCIFDFVAIYAGSSTRPDNELAKFCGNLTANPPLVLVDDQQAVITAVSDINNAHKGFFAEVIFVRNCNERIALTNDDTIAQPLVMIRNYTVNTYDELHCQIRVTAPESYRVKVQVRKLDIISGKCTNNKCEDCNYLEVIQGAQKSDTLSMGKFCANDDDGRRKLVTSDEHALLQFSFTKAGNYSVELVLEIEKSLCGKLNEIQLTGDQAVNIQFPPNNNSEYLPNVHCKWRIKSERDYQIHFEYLLLQPPAPETGKCNDFLRLTQQEITEYYCGNATGFTKYISSQEDDGSSYTELTFHSDDSVEDKGFNITISYQQPCNLTYTRLSGLMDFKAKDNANQTCLADIMVPNEYVLNFNIRATNSYYSGANCSSPNLQINESTTNKNLLQQCISYYYDENLNTNASAIHIFTTSLDSFHMFYYATKRSSGIGCGGEIQTMDGVIRSPSYDDRNFSECRWDITVPEPSHVQVNFIMKHKKLEMPSRIPIYHVLEASLCSCSIDPEV
ncbi:unnamed protein product [Ceratitis capitata]|uniref:(Mediterranean fruit fly) hypothetical protein n=1 Tax=Ceratitis capitata TaxID=7213 RepID=A0A811UWK0_CERCA|nr:unnamed protein product [Ceratitis capitata]